jgi:hypothetical protein
MCFSGKQPAPPILDSVLVVFRVAGLATVRRHINITGLSESAMCKKCGREEECGYYMLRQCPALASDVLEVLRSASLEPIAGKLQ